MRERLTKSLNYLLWFFLTCFIFTWFKDNFPAFRKLRVSPLIPLALLALVVFVMLYVRLKQKRMLRLPGLRINKVFITIVVIVLLAIAFRIPLISHSFGLMTSDHAVPLLMGKHISEGKLPPIYYYGQFYMGSLSEHFYALLFFLFG